jgi:DNA methylase
VTSETRRSISATSTRPSIPNRTYHQIYNNQLEAQDLAQEQAFVDSWTWDDRAREGYQEIISNGTNGYTVQTIELIMGLRNVLGEGSLLAYLVSMTRRVVEIHRVLKPTGSFYLHCDPTASHYLKLVVDGRFCGHDGDFRNEIIWKRTSSHNDARKFADVCDYILYYARGKTPTWNPQPSPQREIPQQPLQPTHSGRSHVPIRQHHSVRKYGAATKPNVRIQRIHTSVGLARRTSEVEGA